MKGGDEVRGIGKVDRWFPGVFRDIVALPVNQVLELPTRKT